MMKILLNNSILSAFIGVIATGLYYLMPDVWRILLDEHNIPQHHIYQLLITHKIEATCTAIISFILILSVYDLILKSIKNKNS